MDQSDDLGNFLRKANERTARGAFYLTVILGFIKLVSIVAGVAIPFFVTFEIIRSWLTKPARDTNSNCSALNKPFASHKYSASQKRPRNNRGNNSTYG